MCKEKHVIVAYNNYPPDVFEVSKIKGKMVEYPVKPYVSYENVAYQWEMQAAFFETNNIKPTWLYAYQNWGRLNYTTGKWGGAVGMIERDEADYALFGFSFTYGRSKVAACLPVDYSTKHWLTRYPLELPPTWNLLGLFTKGYTSQMRTLSNLNLESFLVPLSWLLHKSIHL